MANEKAYQKFINQCCDFCKKANLNTQKDIYNWLKGELMDSYRGRATKHKIEMVAEDFTESICLTLKIDK